MPKIRVFYGWWIVLACAIIGGYGAGAFFYGFTAFVDPLIDEFGWSHASIGFVASFRIVELGVAAPIMGFMVDRWGPRKLMFVGGVLMGGGFILLSQINSLGTFFWAFVLISLACSAAGSVVMMTAVAHWFRRRVSLAMGLLTAGFGLGGFMVPVVIWLIDRYEWESALVVLGISTWCIIPTLALLVRHKPEQYGYRPDGDPHPLDPIENPGESQAGFKPRQVLKTRTFWQLSLALTIQFAGINAVVLYVLDYLKESGINEGSAGWVVMFIPLLSVVGRLGFGWLGDLGNKKQVLAFTIVLQAIGLLLFCGAPDWWALAVFLITFGPGYGGAISLRPAIQREYFGVKAFGTIQGIIMGLMTLGGFAGPVFAGWIFDTRGNYETAWLVFAGAAIAASILVMMIREPEG